MRYVITDGSRWIMQNFANEYVIVNNFTMADSFPRERAEFILHKKLNKRNRKLFRLEKFVEKINDANKPIKINQNIKICDTDYAKKWLEETNFSSLKEDVTKRKDYLVNELSNIDKEISDLLHYVEMSNFNAAKGYDLAKQIKIRRQKRRDVKNELDIIDIIIKNSKNIHNILLHSINKMDKCVYEPRRLIDLFTS